MEGKRRRRYQAHAAEGKGGIGLQRKTQEKIQAQQGAQLASQYSRMLNSGAGNVGNMFTSMVSGAASNIAASGISAVLGKGVSMNSILGLAVKLLPSALSGAITGLVSGQLPQSFLNAGLVAKTMSEFTINQALLVAKKNAMTEALTKNDSQKGDDMLSNIGNIAKNAVTGAVAGGVAGAVGSVAGGALGAAAGSIAGGAVGSVINTVTGG